MKLKIKNLIGIVFLILASCKSETKNKSTEKKIPVVIVEYTLSKFHHSDTTTLTIRNNDKININLFGLESDEGRETIIESPIEINLNDNSQILIDKVPAKLISKKQYTIENKNIVVLKYYYNIENETDEEGFYFVMNNQVVAFNSDVWNLKRFYKYEDSEIIDLLIKDTTDFFYIHKNEKILE